MGIWPPAKICKYRKCTKKCSGFAPPLPCWSTPPNKNLIGQFYRVQSEKNHFLLIQMINLYIFGSKDYLIFVLFFDQMQGYRLCNILWW